MVVMVVVVVHLNGDGCYGVKMDFSPLAQVLGTTIYNIHSLYFIRLGWDKVTRLVRIKVCNVLCC